MKDEEIIKYIKNDRDIRGTIKIYAHLNVLAQMMIKKGWMTEETYTKLVYKSMDKIAEDVVNKLSIKEREAIESQIRFEKDPMNEFTFFCSLLLLLVYSLLSTFITSP